MRALAVSTAKRSSVLPDVPAVAEMLPGFEISGWYGLMAPANTPPEVIRRLNAEVTSILRTPEISTRLRDGGMDLSLISLKQKRLAVKRVPRFL